MKVTFASGGLNPWKLGCLLLLLSLFTFLSVLSHDSVENLCSRKVRVVASSLLAEFSHVV